MAVWKIEGRDGTGRMFELVVPDVPARQDRSTEQAARELECDEDEARWDERLRKVAGQMPAPDRPEE